MAAVARRPTFDLVYKNPKLGLRRSAPALAKATGRTQAAAREYLRTAVSAQAQKAWRRPPPSAYSSTGGPTGEYQADTVHLHELESVNNGHMAILTLVEATTRYAYARALKSGSAADAAVALYSILQENAEDGAPIIRSLVIDGGGEFKGAARALLDRYHIKVNLAAAHTHQRLARVDRYHRTLREQIGRLISTRSGRPVWHDKLPSLVTGYNNAKHRTLGMSPSQMNAMPAAAQALRQVDRTRALKVRKDVTRRAERDGLRVGMWVRVVLNRYSAFSKSSDATWSEPVKLLARIHNNAWAIDPATLAPTSKPPAVVYPTYMIQRTAAPSRVPAIRPKSAARATTAAQRPAIPSTAARRPSAGRSRGRSQWPNGRLCWRAARDRDGGNVHLDTSTP
jgi:hypothetical protein